MDDSTLKITCGKCDREAKYATVHLSDTDTYYFCSEHFVVFCEYIGREGIDLLINKERIRN